MLELFSNFFLQHHDDEDVSFPSNEYISIKINVENYRESVDQSIYAYKSLKTVVIIYDSPDVINNFLYLFSYKTCNMKHVSDIEDMLMINDCIFLN